ncbi:GNAT family N-acetyltransferase [Vibrio makurazakiensis]|uniref:GNAT family N-acetyltransferase n=1 Tax=Vibrio makurazakiensis TaxID=2910250 RepID=UPI003D109CA8
MKVSIELVSLKDVDALLEFELDNRSWFEQHVPPRDEAFYTQLGVKEQISKFLELHAADEMYPLLIRTDSNEICGRINIHRVESESRFGELGYRIGKSFISKGVASSAVDMLIPYLASESKLASLKAIVLKNNVGSSKVLERNGFSKVKDIPNYAKLNGELKDAVVYARTLPQQIAE